MNFPLLPFTSFSLTSQLDFGTLYFPRSLPISAKFSNFSEIFKFISSRSSWQLLINFPVSLQYVMAPFPLTLFCSFSPFLPPCLSLILYYNDLVYIVFPWISYFFLLCYSSLLHLYFLYIDICFHLYHCISPFIGFILLFGWNIL